jgi:hypothetical protein
VSAGQALARDRAGPERDELVLGRRDHRSDAIHASSSARVCRQRSVSGALRYSARADSASRRASARSGGVIAAAARERAKRSWASSSGLISPASTSSSARDSSAKAASASPAPKSAAPSSWRAAMMLGWCGLNGW